MASRRKSGRPYNSGGYSYDVVAATETEKETETETETAAETVKETETEMATTAATEPPSEAAPYALAASDQSPPAATPAARVAAMPRPPVHLMYTRRGLDLKEAAGAGESDAVVAVATGSVSAPPEKAAGGGDNVKDVSGKLLFAQNKLAKQYVAIEKAVVNLKKIDIQIPEVTEAIAVLTKCQLEFLDP